MKVRKSTINDLNLILDIYAKARMYMALNGNPDQWKDNKPLKEDIIFDIRHRHHHIILDELGNAVEGFPLGVWTK